MGGLTNALSQGRRITYTSLDGQKKEEMLLQDVLKWNRICTFTEITQKWGNMPFDRWRYTQLQQFTQTLPQPLWAKGTTRLIEKLF